MASPFTIELNGLNETLKRIEKAGGNVVTEVDAEINSGVVDIERDAVRLAPVDKGFLRGAISWKRNARLNYEVVAQTKYAPYVEFGTITKVEIPAGLEGYAAQFKGKGIKKTGGMRARPFLFPAFRANLPKIIDRIQKIVTKKR